MWSVTASARSWGSASSATGRIIFLGSSVHNLRLLRARIQAPISPMNPMNPRSPILQASSTNYRHHCLTKFHTQLKVLRLELFFGWDSFCPKTLIPLSLEPLDFKRRFLHIKGAKKMIDSEGRFLDRLSEPPT